MIVAPHKKPYTEARTGINQPGSQKNSEKKRNRNWSSSVCLVLVFSQAKWKQADVAKISADLGGNYYQ